MHGTVQKRLHWRGFRLLLVVTDGVARKTCQNEQKVPGHNDLTSMMASKNTFFLLIILCSCEALEDFSLHVLPLFFFSLSLST